MYSMGIIRGISWSSGNFMLAARTALALAMCNEELSMGYIQQSELGEYALRYSNRAVSLWLKLL